VFSPSKSDILAIMGVFGLHSYVRARKLGSRVRLAQLASTSPQSCRKRIIIDGNGLVFHLFERQFQSPNSDHSQTASESKSESSTLNCPPSLDRIFASFGEIRHHVQHLIRVLLACKLDVIVVFDGVQDASKNAHTQKYINDLLVGMEQSKIAPNLDVARSCRIPLHACTMTCAKHAIHDIQLLQRQQQQQQQQQQGDISVLTSTYENDRFIAGYAKLHADSVIAVLGLDSDFYVYDIPAYMPLSSLQYSMMDPYAEPDSIRLVTGQLVTRTQVAKSLGINETLMPILACLTGNDFVTDSVLIPFHERVLSDSKHKSNAISRTALIPKIAKLIQSIQQANDSISTYSIRNSAVRAAVEQFIFTHPAYTAQEQDVMATIKSVCHWYANNHSVVDGKDDVTQCHSVHKQSDCDCDTDTDTDTHSQCQCQCQSPMVSNAVLSKVYWPIIDIGETLMPASTIIQPLLITLIDQIGQDDIVVYGLNHSTNSTNVVSIKDDMSTTVTSTDVQRITSWLMLHLSDSNTINASLHSCRPSRHAVVSAVVLCQLVSDMPTSVSIAWLMMHSLLQSSTIINSHNGTSMLHKPSETTPLQAFTIELGAYHLHRSVMMHIDAIIAATTSKSSIFASVCPSTLFDPLLFLTCYHAIISMPDSTEHMDVIANTQGAILHILTMIANEHAATANTHTLPSLFEDGKRVSDHFANIYTVFSTHTQATPILPSHITSWQSAVNKSNSQNLSGNSTIESRPKRQARKSRRKRGGSDDLLTHSESDGKCNNDSQSSNTPIAYAAAEISPLPVCDKTHESAIVILPPKEVADSVQPFRREFDKGYERWPAHLNLVYPCISMADCQQYKLPYRTAKALQDLPPFQLKFTGFSILEHKVGCTVCIDIEDEPAGSLATLQSRLTDVMPYCDDVRKAGGLDGFRPHITVAQMPSVSAAHSAIEAFQSDFVSKTVTLSSVQLLSRENAPVFRVVHDIPLGSACGEWTAKQLSNALAPVMVFDNRFPLYCPESRTVGPGALIDEKQDEKQQRMLQLLRTPSSSSYATGTSDATRKMWKIPFAVYPTYCFSRTAGRWGRMNASKLLSMSYQQNLRVVTLNVLFDIYDQHEIYSKNRYKVLLRMLRDLDADIIGLQEVTSEFLNALMHCSWVQEQYYLSDSIAGATIQPYGQLLLSKFPFRLRVHAFSRSKRAIVGEMLVNDRALIVPVVHLTSDHYGSMDKRTHQLNQIYSFLCPSGSNTSDSNGRSTGGDHADAAAIDSKLQTEDHLIMGDFNYGDGEDGVEYAENDAFADVWPMLKPHDPGYTFDPHINTVAKITNLTNRRRRLDRILVGANGVWQPTAVELIGTQEFKHHVGGNDYATLYPSDHFGVSCDFTLSPGWSSNTAPTEQHMSLMTGSQSDSKDTAGGTSAGGTADAADGTSAPELKGMTLTDSKLAEPSELIALLESNGQIESDSNSAERKTAIRLLNKSWPRICVDLDGPVPYADRAVGSYQLDITSRGSDIDLVVFSSIPRKNFFTNATRVFQESSDIEVLSTLGDGDAIVPVVKIAVGACLFDIQYCRLPFLLDRWTDLAALDTRTVRRMDVKSALSHKSFMDGIALQHMVPNMNRFRVVYRAIKLWANMQGMYNARVGFLGGYGYMILVAKICQMFPTLRARELVHRFFQVYAQWNWDDTPVQLHATSAAAASLGAAIGSGKFRRTARDVLPIVTVTRPYSNCARNVTATTRLLWTEALARAADCHSYEQLFEPRMMLQEYSSYLRITVATVTVSEFSSWVGWYESRIVSLIQGMESLCPQAVLHPWPFRYASEGSNFPYSGMYYIGVSVQQSSAATADSKKLASKRFARAVAEFKDEIESWEKKTACMDIQIKQVKASSIPKLLREDRSLCPSQFTADSQTGADDDNKVIADDASDPNAGAWLDARIRDYESGKFKPDTTAKLKTSEHMYSYIKWAADLDSSQFSIVYEDRFLGMMESQFNKFDKDRDSINFVPWHRVYKILYKGKVVWDRELRLNLTAGQ
jgi:poly(A) polymerase Pap1/endonuclease/exonuclease/phosphatase family metal-dependent hydrolase/2'-5' RNA ligase/uncharacterized protein (UPF0248 family)